MSEPLISTGAVRAGIAGKGLKVGAIGLVGSIVVGVASTAPAYSLAASLGYVVTSGNGKASVGVHAPFIILLAFVPMYFIAQAYRELNAVDPDCGTTFTWASRAFGSIAGWMGGWGVIIADVVVMANLAEIAGQYTFIFLGLLGVPGAAALAGNVFWVTVLGVLWIAVMTWICFRGIELSARVQFALLGFEVVLLFVFAITALVRVGTGNGIATSIPFDLSWLSPAGLDFGTVIAPALLVGIFIYWGWDSAVSVNEETTDPAKTPGRAALLSTVLLLVTYLLVTIATVSFAGVGAKGSGLGNAAANGGDVFSPIAPALFGSSAIGTVLQVLFAATILTSAAASTQTTILPTARTSLSMAVHRALPARFARIHPRYLTPTWSTIGMGVVSIAFYVLFTAISATLTQALIASIGLMIAFYYGLTGLACVWLFRRTLFTSARSLVFRGLFPLLGFLSLAAIFVYGAKEYLAADYLTDAAGKNVTIFGLGAVGVVGIGGILIGFVLLAVWASVDRTFFRGSELPAAAYVEGRPLPGAAPVV